MPRLNLFLPITKVDAENRIVYGVATAEAEDLAGEVCDYASTKPLYEKWSADFNAASGGKSLGNLRSMHGKIAAGKLTAISFDDAGKRIEIAAKVVDDAEWTKVVEGVYTGFSQGGRYVKRWTDGDLTRYTAQPHEVSLVDLPCLPGATFQMVKVGGAVETRAFASVAEPSPEDIKAAAEALAKGSGKPWAQFADAALNALARDMAKAAMDSSAVNEGDAGEGDNPGADVEDGKGTGDGDAEHEITDDESEEAGNAPARDAGKKKPGETSRKVFEPTQFWACGCADHSHARKADAIKCMAAQDIAKSAASPLSSALDKLEATLGIAKADAPDPIAAILEALFPKAEKRFFSADDRKAAAKDGSAMADGSFPIKDSQDLANAIKAYGRAKNKEAAKKHIEARAKALGLEADLPDDWKGAQKSHAAATLAKGLYDVGCLAQAIQTLAYIYQESKWEREYEGDSSSVPDDLCHLLRQAGEILVAMASEEIGELMPDGAEPTDEEIDEMMLAAGLDAAGAEALGKLAALGAPFAALARIKAPSDALDKIFADLAKAGARNSKADQTRIQGIHDHAIGLGAGCSAGNVGKDAIAGDDLGKSLRDENEKLRKEIADAIPRFEGIAAKLTDRIAVLEAQPAPAKAKITAVEKGADGAGGADGALDEHAARKFLADMKPEERAMFLMKLSLASPTAVIR